MGLAIRHDGYSVDPETPVHLEKSDCLSRGNIPLAFSE